MADQVKPQKKVTFRSPVISEASSASKNTPSEDNSDIVSTCAEAGSEDEIDELTSFVAEAKEKAKEEMAVTDASSEAAPQWTRKEDRLICIMKAKEKSWAEIGKALGRHRRECQYRHRELLAHAKQLGILTKELASIYIDKNKKSNEENGDDKSKDKDKDKAKQDGDPNSEAEDKGKKSKDKKDKNKKGASTSDSSSISENGGEETESEEDEEEDEENLAAEFWAQRRFLYDTMFGDMYPDQKVLRADRFYSESDCRVLAGIEARYRANKWLHIQADFCNATGRMVAAEILKAKFEE
ncbi:hypothetical protein GGR55DRAFT_118593 [Xylaria sp. FL0064]|nr:hypothetical protein GGR55DRAFT_118593 [Xylaria sp. FL0064]